mmetsp:Transcript_17336/g.26240  ORF Transcript_17336/g.26240 Transcript_17336/m.26240 type:complete len:216 (+) Transcript_17336:139-786(+)
MIYSVVPPLLFFLFLLDYANCFRVNLPTHSNNILSRAREERWEVPCLRTKVSNQCNEDFMTLAKGVVTTAVLIASVSFPANAVSGGGLDFANLDITGQDFTGQSYNGKDFTQVIAKGTDFSKSNLQGCRFYKAFLVNADFSGADLRGASLEGTSMDGASLKDANAAGAYFSKSLLDVASLENADFTDAQIPDKTLILVCERDDVTGNTRDSLMCP